MKSEQQSGYFNRDYVDSRHKIANEYKELANQETPLPEKDWGVIWALTGPEETFDEKAEAHPGEEHKTTDYNQTKRRFETALQVAREVTALKCGKKVAEVTQADIIENGPTVYWGGKTAVNDYFQNYVASGEFKKNYDFPVQKIKITESRTIQHTDHQFEDFPKDLVPEGNKVVIVSDFYHLPRVSRYINKYKDKFPAGKSVLYPSQPAELPLKMALQEIRKIPLYIKQGIFPAEEIPKDNK